MRASLLLAFGLSLSVPVHAQLTRTFAEVPMVVLTSAVDLRTSVEALPALQRAGLSVSAVAGEGCYVGRGEASAIAALRAVPGVLAVVTASSDDVLVKALPPGQRIGVRYLNALLAGTFETPAVRAPMIGAPTLRNTRWSLPTMPGACIEGTTCAEATAKRSIGPAETRTTAKRWKA